MIALLTGGCAGANFHREVHQCEHWYSESDACWCCASRASGGKVVCGSAHAAAREACTKYRASPLQVIIHNISTRGRILLSTFSSCEHNCDHSPALVDATTRVTQAGVVWGVNIGVNALVSLLNYGCKLREGLRGRRLRPSMTFIVRIHTSVHSFRRIYSTIETANQLDWQL